MTKQDTCDCSKCQAERILDLARKQAERAPEDERTQTQLGDLVCAIALHAIEHDVGFYDMIRSLSMVHGEMTKQLAQAARVADREAREQEAKGYVQ
jgi:hypothetical protein